MSRDPFPGRHDSGVREGPEYVGGRDREVFEKDEQAFDAVLRNIEVVGGASKRLPISLKDAHPEIRWKDTAGLRDIVAHQYFGLDLDIVWDVVDRRIPTLQAQLRELADESPEWCHPAVDASGELNLLGRVA